ncbi:MAG: ParA family protein [Spirosomataceae bacterium]
MRYTIWNNKGGTGKTSLSFQTITTYASSHPNERVLAIDLCPQANLSELLLGGLLGNGGGNLNTLYNRPTRQSIGGYFQARIPSPFAAPAIASVDYLSTPNIFNQHVPANIDLLAGDRLLEIQSNAITTLANTQLPGVNARLAIFDWINDFIATTGNTYDVIFIDTNPSFSIHTQIALASSERLILPIMADDSSRRAIANVFTLIYGLNVPNAIYNDYLYSTTLQNAGRQLPLVHLIVRNRMTQYMGEASAYGAVLNHISQDIQNLIGTHPQFFTFNNVNQNVLSVTDFGTTGVVAFAEGTPFNRLRTGLHNINGRNTRVNANMLRDCVNEIDQVVGLL